MQLGAFIPQGNQAVLAATDTSTASPIALTPFQSLQPSQVLAYNAGANDVFLTWAPTTAGAVAVMPTAGNPKLGILIPAGAVLTLTAAPAQYYAAICATGLTATLYLIPGEGN